MDITRGVLIALALVLLGLSVAFVAPFLQFFLLAVLLAYLLEPAQRRLTPRIGARVAASLLVLVATLALLIPLVVVGQVVVSEGLSLVRQVRQGDITLAQAEQVIYGVTGLRVDIAGTLQSALSDGGTQAFGSLLGAFGAVTHLFVGLGLTVFLLYYFLKDGTAFMAWLRRTLPLPDHVQNELYAALDDIMWAVLAGHVFVAVVQGVLAGIGLFVVGIPSALFWTAVMVVLSLLPIVGSFLVWGPAVLFLIANDQLLPAVFLLFWGSVIVGLSDNYLRPIVVDRYAQVSPAVIVLGLVGGITVMGIMGLFFGPIVIGALRATLDVFRDEYRSPPGT
ncbi:AI-2E family transporter [Halorientalis brevis]|uniref:AI-2E family transporter n=1 Tax=Halorientalis brevis TaxID=1126241 RepID=A0ABD6C6E0_9EURY|nr:AI-2E family transporter [Halorientalis brevis]